VLSQGVPMICAGDEMGRTQYGNNNAYCQDNEISWTNWDLTSEQRDFLQFSRRVIEIWRDHPVLRRRKFLQGRRIRGADVTDIAWLDPTGDEMTDETWSSPDVRVLGLRLNGNAIDEVDERGLRITGDTLLLMLNAGEQTVPFVLPQTAPGERWETLLDTFDPWLPSRRLREGDRYELHSRSMAVLKLSGRKDDVRRTEDWGPMGVY
jgi:isoamylase